MTIREAATVDGKTLFTYYFECCESPRVDYDNFGHMICWHRRYNLGISMSIKTRRISLGLWSLSIAMSKGCTVL